VNHAETNAAAQPPTFDGYQADIRRFRKYPPEAGPLYPLLGLLSEVGEIAEKLAAAATAAAVEGGLTGAALYRDAAVAFDGMASYGKMADRLKKGIRDNGRLASESTAAAFAAAFAGAVRSPERRLPLLAELGDATFYVAEAADRLDATFGDVASGNVAKLEDRAARGVLGGSGDTR
jgi:hypothetical protein